MPEEYINLNGGATMAASGFPTSMEALNIYRSVAQAARLHPLNIEHSSPTFRSHINYSLPYPPYLNFQDTLRFGPPFFNSINGRTAEQRIRQTDFKKLISFQPPPGWSSSTNDENMQTDENLDNKSNFSNSNFFNGDSKFYDYAKASVERCEDQVPDEKLVSESPVSKSLKIAKSLDDKFDSSSATEETDKFSIQVKSEADLLAINDKMEDKSHTATEDNKDINSVDHYHEDERDNSDEEMKVEEEDSPNTEAFDRVTCPLCQLEMFTSEYSGHVRHHNDMACQSCSFTAENEAQINEHKMSCVPNLTPIDSQPSTKLKGRAKRRCKPCGLEFKTDEEMYNHRRVHIDKDKILECSHCFFVTGYKHHFEYHMKNHTGDKDFKCPQCQYSCVNKSMLNSHMKSHSNFYSFKCKDCNYEAKYMHALKMHCRKYTHEPLPAFNPDGTINPFPIIDVYGTRRGPKVKRDAQGNPIYPSKYTAKISVQSTTPEVAALPSTSSPLSSITSVSSSSPSMNLSSSLFRHKNNSMISPNLCAFPGLINHPPSLFNTPPSVPSLTQFSYLNSPNSPLTPNPHLYSRLTAPQTTPLPTHLEAPSGEKYICTFCSLELPNKETLKIHTVLVHVAKNSPAPSNWQTPTRAPPLRRSSNETNQAQIIERILAAKMNSQQIPTSTTTPLPLLNLLSNQPALLEESKMQYPDDEDQDTSAPLDLTKDHTPPQQIMRRRLSESPGEVSPSSLTPPDTISPKKTSYRPTIPPNMRMESLEEVEEENEEQKPNESSSEVFSDDPPGASGSSSSTLSSAVAEMPFVMDCSMCKITFRSETMYTTHMKFHDQDNPLRCSFCGVTLDNTNEFFEHCYSCKNR